MPAYTEYFVQLVNKRTQMPIDDDTGKYTIMTASTPVAATAYSDSQGTALTLPATMSNGVIRFFTAQSVETVDVTGMTASGHPFFLGGLTPSQHRLEINVDDKTSLTFVLPFEITASTSGWDTGFDLNALHCVRDIKFKVTTAGGTGTVLCVGGSADLSAFGICQVSATGFKYPARVLLSTLLANTLAHSNAAGFGLNLLHSITNQMGRKDYVPGAATNIFLKDGNLTAATGSGYIYMIMDKLIV